MAIFRSGPDPDSVDYFIWPPLEGDTSFWQATDWKEAESRAQRFMVRIGYSDAELTASGSDEGIDVVAAGAVAQVKAQKQRTSRPEVQKLYGVAQAEGKQPLFFSTSGYTSPAIDFADRNGIALFELRDGDDVEPINDAASGLRGHDRRRVR